MPAQNDIFSSFRFQRAQISTCLLYANLPCVSALMLVSRIENRVESFEFRVTVNLHLTGTVYYDIIFAVK